VQSVAVEICLFVKPIIPHITQKVDRRPIAFLYRSSKELNERGLALSTDKVYNTHYILVPLKDSLYIHTAFMLSKPDHRLSTWGVKAKIKQV
jgi:hypothetical protein